MLLIQKFLLHLYTHTHTHPHTPTRRQSCGHPHSIQVSDFFSCFLLFASTNGGEEFPSWLGS